MPHKELLKQQIFTHIDAGRAEAIDFLRDLVALPSETFQATQAQSLVQQKLAALGCAIDTFPCDVASLEHTNDFYALPQNLHFADDIQNVVGVLKSARGDAQKSLLLFSHIDTEERSAVMPDTGFTVEGDDMIGLGVADDKGGVAMMLLGAAAVLQYAPQLQGDLTLMSTIGKRGSVGTFTAFQRGYKAAAGVYLHPAETGHGFKEIKNLSLGWLDFNISVSGKPGAYHDDIDDSEISAVVKGCEVIEAVMAWNKLRRDKYRFQESTFIGQPNTKINVLEAHSADMLKDDALRFDISFDMSFGLQETVPSVFADLQAYLAQYFANDPWLSHHPLRISMGPRKATPAYVPEDAPALQLAKRNIQQVKGYSEDEFIFQHHASSDIRLPNVYGGTPTVGIGPFCGGRDADQAREWLSIADYLDGIKITAGMIVDWCL